MAAIASSPLALAKPSFEQTMENVDVPKHDLNTIVMDYFIQEGYPDAAAAFQKEADIKPRDDSHLSEERKSIKEAISDGDLQKAIEEINNIDPQLLDSNKALHFSLLRLQLIELIKKMFAANEAEKPQLFGTAVTFAQQNLAPYTPQSEKFKSDLERAMALLIVPQEVWQTKQSHIQSHSNSKSGFGPLSDLVDPSLKGEVMNEVTAAIHRSQGRPDYSIIHKVLQTRAWAEDQAREKRLNLSSELSINLWDVPDDQSNNGDTQMTEDLEEGGTDPIQRYIDTESSR